MGNVVNPYLCTADVSSAVPDKNVKPQVSYVRSEKKAVPLSKVSKEPFNNVSFNKENKTSNEVKKIENLENTITESKNRSASVPAKALGFSSKLLTGLFGLFSPTEVGDGTLKNIPITEDLLKRIKDIKAVSLNNPVTDNPTTDNPTTDNPTTDNPVTDNPTTDNPTTDNPKNPDKPKDLISVLENNNNILVDSIGQISSVQYLIALFLGIIAESSVGNNLEDVNKIEKQVKEILDPKEIIAPADVPKNKNSGVVKDKSHKIETVADVDKDTSNSDNKSSNGLNDIAKAIKNLNLSPTIENKTDVSSISDAIKEQTDILKVENEDLEIRKDINKLNKIKLDYELNSKIDVRSSSGKIEKRTPVELSALSSGQTYVKHREENDFELEDDDIDIFDSDLSWLDKLNFSMSETKILKEALTEKPPKG